MATRLQTMPYQPDMPDGQSGGTLTSGRHNRYGWLYMYGFTGKPYPLGGLQSFSVTETNEGRMIPQAGTDNMEWIMGTRLWTGSFRRFQVRGSDLKEMMMKAYAIDTGNASDIDFRVMPLYLMWNYTYTAPSGGQTYENASWQFNKLFVTTYTTDFVTAPNDLVYESASFVAVQETRVDNGKAKIESPVNAVAGAVMFDLN